MAEIAESPRARLIRGTAWSFMATALAKVALVVSSIIVARLLGATQLGVFALLNSVLALMGLVAGLGISGATVKYTAEYDARDRTRLSSLISTSMTMVTLTAGLSAILLILLADPLALGLYNEPRLVGMLAVASVAMFTNAFSAPLISTLQGFQRIRELSVRNIMVTLITVPLTIGFVFIWGLWGAVLALLASSFIGLAVNLGIILRVMRDKGAKLRLGIDRSESPKILRYAIPVFLVGLVVSPISWVVLTLLQWTHGFHAIGLYSVANSLAGSLLLIPTAISTPMIPLVSELDVVDRQRMKSLSSKVLRLIFLLFLPMALALALFGRPVLEILYGGSFVAASEVLYLLSAGTFLIAADNVIVCVLLGTGRVWVTFGLNTAWMIALIVSAFVLVPSLAEVGLGVAYLLSHIVYTAAILAYARRKLGVTLHEMQVVLPVAAFGFTIGVIPAFLFQGWLFYLAGIGVLLTIILGEAAVLQKHEWDLLRGVLRRARR